MSDEDKDVGIPDVPAIVWQEKERIWREQVAQGICPDCNVKMLEWENYYECPLCGEEW